MVAAERDKLQDEVRLTKMQHEDDLYVPFHRDLLLQHFRTCAMDNALSVCVKTMNVMLHYRSRKAAEARREAAALLDKARREQDAAAAAKMAATADRTAADEAAAAQRREAAMLDSTRVRFEEECAERIQQLDAREESVRRLEGMTQRLQEQERALQVSSSTQRM